jgi:hypothetical protein
MLAMVYRDEHGCDIDDRKQNGERDDNRDTVVFRRGTVFQIVMGPAGEQRHAAREIDKAKHVAGRRGLQRPMRPKHDSIDDNADQSGDVEAPMVEQMSIQRSQMMRPRENTRAIIA